MTPRDPSKKPHKRARRMVVGRDTWWWTYGGRGVILWAPTGARYNVHIQALTGMSWADIGDRYDRPGAWPSEVRAFIDRIAAKNIQPRA